MLNGTETSIGYLRHVALLHIGVRWLRVRLHALDAQSARAVEGAFEQQREKTTENEKRISKMRGIGFYFDTK
jgi:hypothetical protein